MPETRLSKKSKIKKLKRSDITDEMRRKFHVCSHNKVGYSEISKLALFMLKRSKQDAKDIKGITEVLTWQKKHIEDLKKINEAMVDKYEDVKLVPSKSVLKFFGTPSHTGKLGSPMTLYT